jgi:hypothetical protein
MPIYSAAYIMASGRSTFGCERKHQNHLRLIEKMIKEKVPYKLQYCKSMSEAYNLLHSYPTIGDFLAYQYVTDINYSTLTNYTEMEFVKAGPGAKDGIVKCYHEEVEHTECTDPLWPESSILFHVLLATISPNCCLPIA